MKEVEIRVSDFATIKRIAQSVNSLVTKRDKAKDKLEKLSKDIEEYQTEIDEHEVWVKNKFGLSSEDLVKRVVEETDKLDAKGNPVKVTRYLPTDIVTYSEEDKCYYATIKEEPMEETMEVPEDNDVVEYNETIAENA